MKTYTLGYHQLSNGTLIDEIEAIAKERDALKAEVQLARQRLGPAGWKMVAKYRAFKDHFDSCEHCRKCILETDGTLHEDFDGG